MASKIHLFLLSNSNGNPKEEEDCSGEKETIKNDGNETLNKIKLLYQISVNFNISTFYYQFLLLPKK